jgi:uncharacterized protein
MEESMKDDLMKLLDAQEIDLEIDNLLKSKKEYPEQIEFLEKEVADLQLSLEELNKLIEETKKNGREIELELKAERESLTKREKRLLETKTNKEYNAVQNEIIQARDRIDALETEDIEIMSKLDEMVPKSEETRQKLEVLLTENTSRIKDMKKCFDSIETDIAKLEQKRNSMLTQVNKRHLAVYNRLRKGKGGIAISRVNKAKLSCRGCFKHLPPQKVLEVRRCNTMLFCENCGRILAWDEREEN